MEYLENINTTLLLEIREKCRLDKNYQLSDKIRDVLDSRLEFVFDTKEGQELHSYSEHYFKNMDKISTLYNITFNSKRQFVEWKIKDDIRINNILDGWIYSMQK